MGSETEEGIKGWLCLTEWKMKKNKSSHEKTASLATHTHNGVTTFDINCYCFCNFHLVLLTWIQIHIPFLTIFRLQRCSFNGRSRSFTWSDNFRSKMTSLQEIYITNRRFYFAQWFHETFLQTFKGHSLYQIS